jgi:cysteine desulfurase/selenocysteine lyase
MLCQQTGARLRVIPVNDKGELQMDVFRDLLNEHTRFLAVTHVSNALGTINPVKEIITLAHQYGVPVMLDGAQAIAHLAVDVQKLDCDFYAFSGHKLYGPTGVGVLYGKAALLDAMPPYQGGGDMIRTVSFEETTYNALPSKFEAGTPNIAGVIGLGAAVDYVNSIGYAAIVAHENALLAYATPLLAAVPGLTLIGNAHEKSGILSFVLEGMHAHDIGTILDRQGVAIRTGHHCTMPLMERFGVPATARASFALYNTRQEIDVLVAGIYKVKEVFKP